MAELRPGVDRLGAVMDARGLWKHKASRLPGKPRPALAAPFRQITREFLALAILRVHEAVDRLVAETMDAAGLEVQSAGDLLGRPAVLEAVDHCRAQIGMTRQLAGGPTSAIGQLLGGHRPVALGLRHLGVVPEVALQLPVDGRAVAAESSGDLIDGNLLLPQPRQLPALLQAQVNERAGHRILQVTPWINAPVAVRNRMCPATFRSRIIFLMFATAWGLFCQSHNKQYGRLGF